VPHYRLLKDLHLLVEPVPLHLAAVVAVAVVTVPMVAPAVAAVVAVAASHLLSQQKLEA